MPSVTPTQIKSVGRRELKPHHNRHSIVYPVRMNGLGETTPAQSIISAVTSFFGPVFSIISNAIKRGADKEAATAFAESANKMFYGMEPGCGTPIPNIQVVAGTSSPRFCASSVAGEIERCQLSQASQTLTAIRNLFQQKISTDREVGPYVQRWLDQYGNTNFSTLQNIISSSGMTCGGVSQLPGGSNTLPYYPPTSTGFDTTTILILGGIAVAAFVMMKR